jgi:signal transduction histidine kinase
VRELGEEVLRVSRELGRLHREAEALRDRLRHEHSERDEILAVVSHELRTPVTVIRGCAGSSARGRGPLTPSSAASSKEASRPAELDAFIERLLWPRASRRGARCSRSAPRRCARCSRR